MKKKCFMVEANIIIHGTGLVMAESEDELRQILTEGVDDESFHDYVREISMHGRLGQAKTVQYVVKNVFNDIWKAERAMKE